MGRHVLAALFLIAAAGAAADDWAEPVRTLWHRIQAVPLDDAVSTREMQGAWLKPGESTKGAYKIEHSDGRIAYADEAPAGTAGVRAVWKRTRAKDQFYEVSGKGTRFYTFRWRRVHWIAEHEAWKTGSPRRNREKEDDALAKDWMRAVGRGPHMKGAGVSWNSAHRRLIRDLAGLHTSRERLERLTTGKTRPAQGSRESALRHAREAVDRGAKNVADQRAKLEKGLRQAGENLGVGDALWLCEDATLRLYEAKREQGLAEGRHATYNSLAKRKPEYEGRATQALRDLENAGGRVQRIRRQRRHSMARVMRAID